jgi:uncharacterized FlaG/YvyC family protein
MSKKASRSGLYGLVATAVITAIGATALGSVEDKSEKQIKSSKKGKTNKTAEKVDDLTTLMNYMNKRLIAGTLSSQYYMSIGQQACKEYQQLGGRLNLGTNVDEYIDDRIKFIDV